MLSIVPFLVAVGLAVVAGPGVAHSASPPPCASAAGLRSFADVLARLEGSSRSEALGRDLAAVRALEAQAAARPNPELVVDLQDFTGSDEYAAFGQSQNTLSLSQRLEVGGRRAARVEAAERESSVEQARTGRETVRLAVAAKQGFVEVLVARARVAVRRDGEALARRVLADAGRREAGGAASSVDVERANIAVTTAALEVSAAEREAAAAAQRLSQLWGGSADELDCLDGRLPPPARLHASESTSQGRSPGVALAEAEVEARRADVTKARAEALPDVEIGAGLRHLAGPDEVSVVAGLSVEVPIFDRGAGTIASAEHKLFAAQARARVAEEEAAGRAARLRQTRDGAAERASVLASQAVPSAERAYAALSRAWREGAASSLEVLEARRTLVSLRLEQLDATAEYHRSLVALEGNLGAVSAALDAPPAPPRAPSAREED
ncbi:MAG: TolC family protein [Candidatus Binatia bacterium]